PEADPRDVHPRRSQLDVLHALHPPGSVSRPVADSYCDPVSSSVMESAGYRRLLYSASAVIFGVMGQAVGRGWLAKDLTGSNAGLGGVMLAFGISMLVATPWG